MESKFTSLREINQYKKKLNWGELPAFFHQVSNSLGELEGIYKHGFDNAVKRILNKQNWNLSLLGGVKNRDGSIVVERKPRIVLYRRNTEWGYEVHCVPLLEDGTEVHEYLKDDPDLAFKVWEPHTMRNLIRVVNLAEFIRHTYLPGDDADRELVKYAHMLTEQIVIHIGEHIDIVKDGGYSINEMLSKVEEYFGEKGN